MLLLFYSVMEHAIPEHYLICFPAKQFSYKLNTFIQFSLCSMFRPFMAIIR
jgi:hypothetical protein